jgi:hypothetical protein
MDTEAQRLTIEIEPGEPIHGRLLDSAGEAHAFRGWLELSATLERLRRICGEEERTATERGERSATLRASREARP